MGKKEMHAKLKNLKFIQTSGFNLGEMFNLNIEKVVAPGRHCEGLTCDTLFH